MSLNTVKTSSHIHTFVIIVALATGFVMASLDVTIVNLAGPSIQRDLGASLTELTWIIDGYVLTFSSLLLLGGGLAKRFGVRRVYLTGLFIFLIASIACALSINSVILIIARMLQGIGAAFFMPSSMALLVNSFPDQHKRAKLLGFWSAMVAAASAIGPTLGGFLVHWFGWASIFLVNLPVGLIGFILTLKYVAPIMPQDVRVPFRGNIFSIIFLTALCLILIEGNRLGWLSTLILAAYIVVVFSLIFLIQNEKKSRVEVMPWELFRNIEFSGSNAIGFLFNSALFGSLFVFAQYFQHVRGMSAVEAGIAMLPMTFFLPFANIFYSWIIHRIAGGILLTIFLGTATLGTIGLAFVVTQTTPYYIVALVGCLANIGAGVVSPSMTAILINSAGNEHSAAAGAALNTNRQIGSLVGIAVTGTILGLGFDGVTNSRIAFIVAAIAYAIALGISYLVSLCMTRNIA